MEKGDQILSSYSSKSNLENSDGVCLRIFFNGTEREEGCAWGEWRGGGEALYIKLWKWCFINTIKLISTFEAVQVSIYICTARFDNGWHILLSNYGQWQLLETVLSPL